MEHEKHSRLIGTLSTNKVTRTPDCPDDHELAALVDGGLTDDSSDRFIAHLANCDYCMSQVGLLKRLNETAPVQPASELTLARARRFSKNGKRPAFKNVSRWACAAVIVLALSLLIKTSLMGPDGSQAVRQVLPDSALQTIDPRQSRNLNTDVLKPQILIPVNGATIDPGNLVFNWTEVPGSLHYDVRVVTDGGDLVWQSRIADTKLELPANLQLDPESEYFFRVDAYLATAKSLHSEHLLFTVGGHR